MPQGFQSNADIFAWPDKAFMILKADDSKPRVARLLILAKRGVDMHSFMAGKGTDAFILRCFGRCLREHHVLPMGAEEPFQTISATDGAKECLEVLGNLYDGPQRMYKHIFGKTFSRYSTENGGPHEAKSRGRRCAAAHDVGCRRR